MVKNIYLRCNNCSRTFSFYGNNPIKDEIMFCPSCGSMKIKFANKQFDYWEELSIETMVPTILLKEMFSLWDPNEMSFYDYVKTYTKDAA